MVVLVKGLRFQVAGIPGSSENLKNAQEFIALYIHPAWSVRLRKESNNANSDDHRAIRVEVSGNRCAGYVAKEFVPELWNLMGDFEEVNANIGEVKREHFDVILDEEEIYFKRQMKPRVLPPFPRDELIPDTTYINHTRFVFNPYEAMVAVFANKRPLVSYRTKNGTITNEIKTDLLQWLKHVDMTKRFYSYSNAEVIEIITALFYLFFLAIDDANIILN